MVRYFLRIAVQVYRAEMCWGSKNVGRCRSIWSRPEGGAKVELDPIKLNRDLHKQEQPFKKILQVDVKK